MANMQEINANKIHAAEIQRPIWCKQRKNSLLSGVITCVFALLCSGCMGTPPPPFNGQAHALRIAVRSTTDLNSYSNRAHVLALYVIQAEKAAPIIEAKASTEACLKLLQEAGKTKGVTRFQMIEIQPGAKLIEYYDLVADTTWVGVIAAYYNMDAKKCVLGYALPSGDDKAMNIDLILGPDNILKSSKSNGDK